MFHCTGIFIKSVEHVLHKINSFWNFYYIINFLRNTYHRGTSVPSQYNWNIVESGVTHHNPIVTPKPTNHSTLRVIYIVTIPTSTSQPVSYLFF